MDCCMAYISRGEFVLPVDVQDIIEVAKGAAFLQVHSLVL